MLYTCKLKRRSALLPALRYVQYLKFLQLLFRLNDKRKCKFVLLKNVLYCTFGQHSLNFGCSILIKLCVPCKKSD